MTLSLVLADPQPIFLMGMEQMLSQEADVVVRACCATAAETCRALCMHNPDLLTLDLHLPDRNSLDLLRDLKKDALPTRVVVLTDSLDDEQALELFHLGFPAQQRAGCGAFRHPRPPSRRPAP